MKTGLIGLAAACVALATFFLLPKGRAGDAANGKAVFEQCAVCHNANSTEKKTGPGLKGLFQRAKLHNGNPVTDESVRARIDNGANGMPPYKDLLTGREKDDVIAFLKTL